MNKDNLKSLKEVLDEFAQQKNIKKPLLEAKVVNMWKPLMGDLVDRYTETIYVNNKTLFVKVKVSSLKNELVYLQEDIINKINKEIGEDFIKKLVIL
ncbi:MAG: DUF721 domain-containing protein [Chitinophagales bacterium]|nr:DUF721 domain-containing protein [Chitinophagales bacterium]